MNTNTVLFFVFFFSSSSSQEEEEEEEEEEDELRYKKNEGEFCISEKNDFRDEKFSGRVRRRLQKIASFRFALRAD
jgi:hypothetical protein